MKIKVIGAYGESNFGDDLLMSIFENFFIKEFQNVELNFIGENADYTDAVLIKSHYNKANFKPDWIVYGGGTQFFSFNKDSSLSFIQKLKVIFNNPQIILNKLKNNNINNSNSKVAFLGFGIGPFYENQKVINYSQNKLKQASFLGVRDAVSQEYCNQWGLKSELGADVAFSSYFELPKLEKKQVNKKKNIGIILRDWKWENSGSAYIDTIIDFYKNINDENQYQFIIFSSKKDKNIIDKVGEENCLFWNPKYSSINEFLKKLNGFDALITARYHGAIIFALLGKPVICIEIEEKLRILSQQIPEFLLWEKPFDIVQLKHQIANLDYEVNYQLSLNKLRKKADQMLNEFKLMVN